MSQFKHYLHLHFIILIWGFTAVLGLLINIPVVETVFYRTLLASVALGILLYFRKRNFRLGQKQIGQMLGTGALIAAHWILFFGAARVANASVCLAGMATCSLWTSMLEPLMTRRKIQLYEVVLGLIVIIGLYVIFRFEFGYALGLIMAILSAILASVFTIINSKFTRVYNPYMITFYEMAGACLSIALFFPFYAFFIVENGHLQLLPSSGDWLYILILALICTVYAYSASVELMKHITAFAMNLATNMEPVYGIILAVIIFGDSERMTPAFYTGTSIILLSVLAYPVINHYRNRKKLRPRMIQ